MVAINGFMNMGGAREKRKKREEGTVGGWVGEGKEGGKRGVGLVG